MWYLESRIVFIRWLIKAVVKVFFLPPSVSFFILWPCFFQPTPWNICNSVFAQQPLIHESSWQRKSWVCVFISFMSGSETDEKIICLHICTLVNTLKKNILCVCVFLILSWRARQTRPVWVGFQIQGTLLHRFYERKKDAHSCDFVCVCVWCACESE